MAILFTFLFIPASRTAFNIFGHNYDKLDQKYGSFTEDMRVEMLDEGKHNDFLYTINPSSHNN